MLYFEDFSMGVYDCGDIMFKNVISAMNNKSFYWKTYRRGENSDEFCNNCTFYNNYIQIMGTGGTGMCGLLGTGGTEGSMCVSHYILNDDNDFGTTDPIFYTETQADGVLQMTDVLIFYNGYK